MNEKLQFSWGHIIAFLALIAVTYFSFMGFTFMTGGNLTYALCGALITMLIYVLVFIGAQQMKASGEKIAKKIRWERILIFASPAVFVAGMISVAHFWAVRNNSDVLIGTFKNSVELSRQLFSEYEDYSQKRLSNYNALLDAIIANKATNPGQYQRSGFKPGMEAIQKENMMETLRIRLLSENFTNARNQAMEWIDKSTNGASIWNIFLIGNKYEVQKAVTNWEELLRDFAAEKMSNEELNGPVADFTSEKGRMAIESINTLDTYYKKGGFTVAAVFFGIVIYLMLLFPYFIQQRHGRQVAMRYSLLKNGTTKKELSIDVEDANESDSTSPFASKTADSEMSSASDSSFSPGSGSKPDTSGNESNRRHQFRRRSMN